MVCDLYLRIVWESVQAMELFFTSCNEHIQNLYPHLLNGDNKGQDCERRIY
jgi:hypothetical protein